MWDTNPPPFVAQLRVELIALASVIAEIASPGNEAARMHYPRLSLADLTLFPSFLLTQSNMGIGSPAEGAAGIPTGGALLIDVYLAETANGGTARSTGYLETFAQTMMKELFSVYPRIIPYNGPAQFEQASDPTPGAEVADKAGQVTSFHHLRIRIPVGYNF